MTERKKKAAKERGNVRESARARRSSSRNVRQPLGREDWIAAARIELIAAGVNAVKVDRLARRLRVTRGGFYWHFTSRADLLRGLLKSWERESTVSFERVLTSEESRNGPAEFLAFAGLWIRETEFVPAYDTAVRDWARVSRDAAAAVRRVDERRIEVLHRIFKDLGFVEPEALVRARITYFHQVGYYAIDMHEERGRRRELAPVYLQVLSGLPLSLIVSTLAQIGAAEESSATAAASAAPSAG
jgi:AcrR family transcriptional regulator